ncbi:MAG: cell division protein ZapA [Spirochaetales bacterium]|nr:cell division protein ZapA [Spirochaetales bacterium]
MEEKNKIRINLLGTSFTIQSGEDNFYLNQVIDSYKRRIQHIENTSKIKDPLKLAILTGLNLMDELYKEKEKSRQPFNGNPDHIKLEEITERMISKIDETLASNT